MDLTEAWLGGWLLAFAVVSIERGDWLWGACVGLVGAYYTARACAMRRKQAQKDAPAQKDPPKEAPRG